MTCYRIPVSCSKREKFLLKACTPWGLLGDVLWIEDFGDKIHVCYCMIEHLEFPFFSDLIKQGKVLLVRRKIGDLLWTRAPEENSRFHVIIESFFRLAKYCICFLTRVKTKIFPIPLVRGVYIIYLASYYYFPLYYVLPHRRSYDYTVRVSVLERSFRATWRFSWLLT